MGFLGLATAQDFSCLNLLSLVINEAISPSRQSPTPAKLSNGLEKVLLSFPASCGYN